MHLQATGMSGIVSMDMVFGYEQPQGMMSIKCVNVTATLNDNVDAYVDGTKIFKGNVKSIVRHRSQEGFYYNVTIYDKLIQASDYYMAASDPNNPYQAYNVAAETLVGNLLALAGLSGYISSSPGLTLATTGSYPIDRVFAYDMVRVIADWCGYHVWCDTSGSIHFQSLPPYPQGPPSHNLTVGDSGELIMVARTLSEEKLRNRVVVYGLGDLVGESSASSPYLPDGFYKTAVFGHGLMDTQAAVDDAADYNLELWNRPTEIVECELVGDKDVQFGQTITVSEPSTETSGSWFVRDIHHHISEAGFITRLTLSR